MKRAILTTQHRTYFTVSDQAAEFIQALMEREWLAFVRRAQILDHSLSSGRPSVRVAKHLEGSSENLWELRVKCGRGPQIRFLYFCHGKEVLIVRCLRKREEIRRRDIELADRDAKRWKIDARPGRAE